MNETLEAIRVLGLWRVIWARTGYRPLMRLAHRFNWHHMRRMPIIEPNRQQVWCEWCGVRDMIYIGPPTITAETEVKP